MAAIALENPLNFDMLLGSLEGFGRALMGIEPGVSCRWLITRFERIDDLFNLGAFDLASFPQI